MNSIVVHYKELALKGRDFFGLMTLLPGVVDNGSQSRDSTSSNAIGGIYINGGRSEMKNITVDAVTSISAGSNNNTPFQPNMDSIAEVRVLTSNYQAEYGRSGAGLISVITKSGGREFHGTGWWIGGEHIGLVGGHANWHPPGLEFTVQIDDRQHPITAGIDDFTVQDEIYMSAWDPSIHVLATAGWADRRHPMAWTHGYGEGRVFYTTLGHGPSTFENPTMQRLLGNAARWAAGA